MKAKLKYLLISLIILFLVVNCDKSTDSKKNDTDDVELLTSESIGVEGGSLSDDQITITIPPASFSSNVNLKLYEDKTKEPFGSDQISKTYFIEGIPDAYNLPVEIMIKYDGQMSGVGKIAVGEENILSISDEGSLVYSLFSAVDSSGFLTASIPAPYFFDHTSKTAPKQSFQFGENSKREIIAIKNQTTPKTTSDGNFIVHYPAFLTTSIKGIIAEDLMKFLQMIKAMNFKTDDVNWPINVHISPLNERDENRNVTFAPFYGNANLYVDSEDFKDFGNNYQYLSCGMGRELFHAIISKYDFYYFKEDLKNPNLEHFWFHTAVALWAEEKFRALNITVPIAFWGEDYLFKGDRGGAPFRGLQKGIGTTKYEAYKHGCGMAAMFKYLVRRYGESLILNIYNDISNTDCHPVTALIRNISDPVNKWWPEFMRSYLAGDIYKYSPLGLYGDYLEGLQTHNNNIFRINNDRDTFAYYTPLPPDISATDFAVMLDDKDIDSSASLRATVDNVYDNGENLILMMYGFGIKASPFGYFLEPWEEVTKEVTVSNLRVLKDNNYHGIVFVLTNTNYHTPDYKGDRIVGVEFEVLTPILNYDWCDFIFYCDMKIKSIDIDTTSWVTDMAVGQTHVSGGFHGNTFIGTLNPDIHYEEGTIEIELDPKTNHVIGFKYNSFINDEGLTNSWSVENKGEIDIPVTFMSPFNDAQENNVYGQYVCDNSNVEMLWQFSGTTQTVEAIFCNGNSYIMIAFGNSTSK